ncbi:MAG: DUF58 domain-containing protein [Persicimonas sp.]
MSTAPKTQADEAGGLREKLEKLTRPPRRLSFTKTGKLFVLMTLGVGFGAINTGNNLLFLLLGLMLSLIIASGVLSEAVIRHLVTERDPPRRLFADRTASGAFQLENPAWWPSLSVEVAERPALGEIGPMAGKELGPDRPPWWKFWKSGASGDSPLDRVVASAYSLRVEPGARELLPTRYRFPARGAYRLTGLQLITRFPFGFFEKRREFDQPDRLVVYPTPAPAEEWVEEVHSRFGDIDQNERGQGEEYFGLREYRPGEDQRLIHWKSSARRGEVVVRETERQEQRAVEIDLLNCTGQPARRRHRAEAIFEEGLGQVVGLIDALQRAGYRVGLRTLGEHLPANDTATHLDQMLHALALVELRDGVHSLSVEDDSVAASGRILVGLDTALSHAGGGYDLVLPLTSSPAAHHDE